MKIERIIISYFIKMLVAKTYQRSGIAALQLVGVISETIADAPMIPDAVKPVLIREATGCYFDMWTKKLKGDNGYDE